MDGHLDSELLEKKVVEVLKTYRDFNECIPDDTLLEKFENLMRKHWLSTETQCVQRLSANLDMVKSLVEFMKVCSQQQSETEKMVLALRLGPGLLAAVSVSHAHYGDGSSTGPQVETLMFQLFTVCLTEQYWVEPSIRNAWHQSMTALMSSSKFFHKIISNKGYLEKIIKCLADSSIYVCNAARSALSSILETLLPDCDVEATKDSLCSPEDMDPSRICVTLLQDLCQSVTKPGTSNIPAQSAVPILAQLGSGNILSMERTELLRKYLYNRNIHNSIIENIENQQLQAVVDDSLKILINMRKSGFLQDEDVEILCNCPSVLLQKGSVKQAIQLAYSILHLDMCVAKRRSELLELVQLPVMAYTGMEASHHWCPDVTPLTVTTTLLLSLNTLNKLPARDVSDITNCKLVVALVEKLALHTMSQQAVVQQLKHSALQFMRKLLDGDGLIKSGCLEVETLFMLLLKFVKGSTPLVTEAGYKSSVQLLRLAMMMEDSADRMLAEMLGSLQRSLSEVLWEVRDTGLQTISSLALLAQEHGKLAQWLAESNLPELAMQCTHDGEAYVRASALSALKHLITLPPLQHMTQVYSRSAELVTTDEEAITRRAAVQLLCDMTPCQPYTAQTVLANDTTSGVDTSHLDRQCFILGLMADLDWQVKLTVLQYCWQMLQALYCQSSDCAACHKGAPCARTTADTIKVCTCATAMDTSTHISSQEVKAHLQRLCDIGCLSALLHGVHDCDHSVRYRACDIVLTVAELCKHHAIFQGATAQETASKQACPQHTCQNIEQLEMILSKLKLQQIKQLANYSTDTYETDPVSLLQDLLVTMQPQSDEHQTLDCY